MIRPSICRAPHQLYLYFLWGIFLVARVSPFVQNASRVGTFALSLSLPMPDFAVSSKDVTRLYLQAILSRGIVSEPVARLLHKKCIEAVNRVSISPSNTRLLKDPVL